MHSPSWLEQAVSNHYCRYKSKNLEILQMNAQVAAWDQTSDPPLQVPVV